MLCEGFGFRAQEFEMRCFAVYKDSMHETLEERATEINITNVMVWEEWRRYITDDVRTGKKK